MGQEKEGPVEDSKTIQFAVLMRKGPKQTLKEVAVPKDSDMAQNLLKQEEAQRLEKERMKKLTLEINERQEEEEVNEAIAMVRLIFVRLCRFLSTYIYSFVGLYLVCHVNMNIASPEAQTY